MPVIPVQNPEAHAAAKKAIGFQTYGAAPDQCSTVVTPVFDISPRANKISNIIRGTNATNATSGLIYTTPTDQDFYITALTLSVIKDVTATSTLSAINAVIDGVTQNLLTICCLTLTVQADATSLVLTVPIKVDRGTAIYVTNSTATANVRSHAIVHGYLE